MKKIIFWMGVILVIVACSTQKKTVGKIDKPVEIATDDNIEYELETFDMNFETWYVMHDSPAQYRSQSYYEVWNQRYVDAWNYNTDMQKARFLNPS